MIKSKQFLFFSIFACCICFLLHGEEEKSDITVLNARLAQQAMANPDYRVLPGDVYKLGYTIGQTAVEYSIVVDSSGSIRVSNLGSINTTGKTFIAVKKQVETLVSQNYPLSVVQFVLISPSNFTVTVKGEVSIVSEKMVSGLSRASSILVDFYTDFSSMRYFTITSTDGKVKSYDLFKARRHGDLTQDPYLSPGDVITIPRVQRRVSISGAVERPGTYELLETDTVKELIEYYGNGYREGVGVNKKQIQVSRIKDDEIAVPDTFFVDIDNPDFVLQHKDTVHVQSKLALQPKVYIELPANGTPSVGEVFDRRRVVSINFAPGDDVARLIRNYSSLFNVVTVDTSKAFILRGDQQLPVNLRPILFNQGTSEGIPLEPDDRLIVPEVEHVVTVSGAVVKPGSYPYTYGRKWDYYIALAGGFDTSKNSGGAVLIQDVYGNKLSKNDIIGPNTIIAARSNAFMYNFNMYVPLITATATVVSAVVAVLTLALKLK